MPEPLVWDLDRHTPNVALERIRLALLAGDDVWAVLDVLLGMFDDAAAERDQLRADLDALAARVTALEPVPPAPTEPEEPLP